MDGRTADILAIRQLVARYGHALDAGDGEGWASTFVADGRFETVGREPLVGRAAIAAAIRDKTPFASRHFPDNLVIEVTGDTARMQAYLKVIGQGGIRVTGAYEDSLRRENGEWLFVERRFTFDAGQPA